MKKTLVLLFLAMLFVGAKAQSDLPNVTLKNLDGETVNVSELNNDGKPFVMTFWATWCKPCIQEHGVLSDLYQDWQDETGVKIFAVSIDNSNTVNSVGPLVNGRGWEFDVLLDTNQELKRAMNVANPPHTFLFDGNGKKVYEHAGYSEGSEEELYEKILEISK